ncbi:hypothetical protein PROP_02649 [Propionicimonas sp. T2.31MG-18]|uniref:Ig-like domain-containing protein n=1 Tax=Propionicimonas sp. T2.31MG-18 TaxID=3157620 RepID=UPI0035E8251E
MDIRKTMRAAAVGVLTAALLVGSAASAFAGPGDPVNPQPNGSKGSFYLWNADEFTLSDGDTSRVYTKDENLVGAASATDFNAEINPSATRPVTGATAFTGVYRFISDKTAAARDGGISTWKAFAVDSATGPNGGTQLPNMTLVDFGPSVPSVIGTGGSFWYGIAYTTNNGLNTVGAVYREINITAGSGNYTVGAVEVEAAGPAEVATATNLAASPTSVEAGGTSMLTATVSSTPAASGNVEFFKGTTSLGSVAVANGTASKSVTIGTVGDHTFTAKFIENTVGSNKFLGSTSAAVTVTGTQPTVPTVPNGPSENALNATTANGATATYDEATHKATLTVDAANNGKVVNVFAYSTPTYLGQLTVADGKITVDVSTLAAGVHKLAIVDPSTGDVLAWASFTKSDAATKPEISKTINAHVAGSEPADGEFSLTNLSGGDTVVLDDPALVNGASVASGELGNFKVTDLRQVSKPGWTLKTDVAKFTKGTDEIEASALGIAPKVVSQAGTGATAPTLGAATTSGSAVYPWNFAELNAGGFSGVSTYNADLVFTAPAGKPAGVYNSTLTLTLISK